MHIAGFRNSARRATRIGPSLRYWLFMAFAGLTACGVPNDPNPPGSERTNTYFTATQESSPKYLDPTSSYSTNETPLTYQIYEPLFRYHYLKRPYVLEGRAAEAVPLPRYYDKAGNELPADAPGQTVAESVYDIKIKKGILFAPHPAFFSAARPLFSVARPFSAQPRLEPHEALARIALRSGKRQPHRYHQADNFHACQRRH